MVVYLCGSMTKDERHARWREEAEARLAMHGIGVLSPMRKETLQDEAGLTGCHDAKVSVARDLKDLAECDVVLINTLGIETLGRQSIGTWCEMGLAAAMGKPILVIGDHFMVTGHPFVQTFAMKVCASLANAIDVLLWLD